MGSDTLSQHIVVKNQFTVKGASGRGSRGSSPQRYILEYTARSDATSQRSFSVADDNLDDYVTGYMARESATESVHGSGRGHGINYKDAVAALEGGGEVQLPRLTLKERRKIRSATRKASSEVDKLRLERMKDELALERNFDGVAYGSAGVGLSDGQLRESAKRVQDLYDDGHTVFKTVLSFDHDFLVEHGIVDDEVAEPVPPGGYRGHIDERKLRVAIRDGLARMERTGDFGDLEFVGTIHLDTEHVHTHLTMVDKSPEGRRNAEGEQRGKLSAKEMSQLRRGIDASLDRTKNVKHLSANVQARQLATKGFILERVGELSEPSERIQDIYSALPDNRRLWRAKSNAKEMVVAKRLAREFVTDVLADPESPRAEVEEALKEYADFRAQREGLSDDERQRLIDKGWQSVVDKAVNGIFSELKAMPEHSSVDPVHSASATERLDELSQRHETFSERRDEHVDEACEMFRRHNRFRLADHRGEVDDSARVMDDFYRVECEVHERLVVKYQCLTIPVYDAGIRPDVALRQVAEAGQRAYGVRGLVADGGLSRIDDAEAAEKIGRVKYGVSGGGALVQARRSGDAVARQRWMQRQAEDDFIEAEDRLYESMLKSGMRMMGPTHHRPEVDSDEPEDAEGASVVSQRIYDPIDQEYRTISMQPIDDRSFDDVAFDDVYRLPEIEDVRAHDAMTDRQRDAVVARQDARMDALAAAADYVSDTDQPEAWNEEIVPVGRDLTQAQSMVGQDDWGLDELSRPWAQTGPSETAPLRGYHPYRGYIQIDSEALSARRPTRSTGDNGVIAGHAVARVRDACMDTPSVDDGPSL